MSKEDFSYHLTEFMSYVRKMEESLSANWDKTTRFQDVLIDNADNIVQKLSDHERITDLKSLSDGIKSSVNDSVKEIRTLTNELWVGIKRAEEITSAIRKEKKEFLGGLHKSLESFSSFNPEIVATKGALKALDMVSEFKEAYEYVLQIKSLLSSKELPDFGFFPKGVDQSMWMRPISDLEFSVRTTNCLASQNIKTIGDLCMMSEFQLRRARNMGRKCITEIQQKLDKLGLRLGMENT